MKFNPPIPVQELLTFNLEIIGNDAQLIQGINEIHNVEAGDLTFVDHEKYYDFTLNSAATFILINKKIEAPPGKVLLVCEEPFKIYNQIGQQHRPSLPSTQSIAESATIGEGTFIYPNAFVGENVKIGRNCVIHPNVTIYNHCQIGDNVVIHGNSCIGGDAFYYKRTASQYLKMQTVGTVVIEDDVEIGPGCTIDAGVSSITRIGRGTKLDSQVHIGHDVKVGEHCILCAQVGIAGNTKLGNFVTLYGKVGVNKNIEIGDRVVVLAGSLVPKSIPNGETHFGYPADEMRLMAKQAAILKKLPELWQKLKKL